MNLGMIDIDFVSDQNLNEEKKNDLTFSYKK